MPPRSPVSQPSSVYLSGGAVFMARALQREQDQRKVQQQINRF
jgi:hypothetical protein